MDKSLVSTTRAVLLLLTMAWLVGCSPMSDAASSGTRVSTFLMFQDGRADEAMRLYVSLVPDSRVIDTQRYGVGEPGPEGSLKTGVCEIAGHRVMFSDSFIKHDFEFTPSTSIFVDCVDETELGRLVAGLAAGGETLMPLDDYGFSRRFAWIRDRFGVSWQLNLP